MSLKEIMDALDSATRINRRRMKEQISIAGYNALEIMQHIAAMLSSSERELRKVWDFFPGLYEEEKAIYDQEQLEEEFDRAVMNRKIAARKSQEKYGKPSE